jgi:hypothetical protein
VCLIVGVITETPKGAPFSRWEIQENEGMRSISELLTFKMRILYIFLGHTVLTATVGSRSYRQKDEHLLDTL